MNPSGTCLCGCGEKTPLAMKTQPRYGLVKGQPCHYVPGHWRLPERPMTKVCADCGIEKPVTDFYSRGRDRFGYPHPRAYCKRCDTRRRQASYETNRKAQNRTRRDNRRRQYADPEWRAIFNERRRKRSVQRPPEGMVEAAPIREAVEASGLPMSEVAGRIGVDESSVRRSLRGEQMGAERAARILEAVGLIPAEVGL